MNDKLATLVGVVGDHTEANAFGWRIQASIGAAVFPEDGSDHRDLLKCADMALYAAKQSGRGCARVFEGRYRREAEWRADIRSAIQRALAEDELFVQYQPIVDLQAARPMAFEALLRWKVRDGSVMTPAVFANVFDDERTAADIGAFVLTEVLSQIDRWNAQGVPFQSIAINATLGDFRSSKFVDRIIQAIDTGRIRGDQLCVEITEGMLLDRGARTVWPSIDRLHDRGVHIAFDDFGTGFASLTHLRQLPIDHVKIDRSFIESICAGGKDRVIVESVIDLAHRLGLRVVAEGVEASEQETLLRGLQLRQHPGIPDRPGAERAACGGLHARLSDRGLTGASARPVGAHDRALGLQPRLERQAHRVRQAGHLQLVHQMRAIGFDRAGRQASRRR